MWGKILLAGKKFIGAKAKEAALKKGTEVAEESSILSKIGQIPMLIGCTGISALALLLITPLIIFVGSFGSISLMQGVDPFFTNTAYANEGAASSGAASSVVDCARNQIGKPYVWGAEGPDSFDCSGLVTYCYREALGVTVGHWTITQYSDPQFITVSSVDELSAGDIILDGGSAPSHVGIYTGNGTVIHAPTFNDYVREVSLSEFYGWVAGNETFRHYNG